MPAMRADVVANRTPPVAAAPTKQPAAVGPPRSTLTGRAQPGTNPLARSGILGKIITFGQKLLNRVCPAEQPSAPRVASLEQRETIFAQKLRGLGNALTSGKATSQTVKRALLDAEAAGVKLQEADGSPQRAMSDTFQKLCESTSTTALNRLITAFDSAALVGAQQLLTDHPNASETLVTFQQAINHELSKRAKSTVAAEIDTAVSVMQSGGPAERVTEHLRLAFAAAAPYIKNAVRYPGPPTDQHVRRLIREHLENLPPEKRDPLLAHLSHEHLTLLVNDFGTQTGLIGLMLRREIQARPGRMFADVANRADHVGWQCKPNGPMEPHGLVTQLREITRAIQGIQKHETAFGAGAPAELAEQKKSLVAALKGAISSGKLALDVLTTSEIADLSMAFNTLDTAEVGEKLLAGVQGKMIHQCTEAYEQSLHRLGTLLSANPPESEELLNELGRFAASTQALTDTARTFASGSHQVDAHAIMNDVVGKWLAGVPEGDLSKLKLALAGPSFTPLAAALGEAERAARTAQNSKLANQLQSMAGALRSLAGNLQARVGPVATTSPALPESMQQALGKLHGLNITGKPTKLSTGQFNTEQRQKAAELIGRHPNVAGAKLVDLGGYDVSWQFLQDQRARTPAIQIDTGAGVRPLVDQDNWPNESEMKEDRILSRAERARTDKDARVLDGYERLIDFCGGNEEEARTLSLRLQTAGLVTPLVNSPLQLDDGMVGTLDINKHGGGADSVAVNLSKGPNGRPLLDVTYRCEGRNVFTPVYGSDPIYLSADSSAVFHYQAELVDGGLRLINTPSYSSSLKRDNFQKPYEPPTAAAIRGMGSDSNSLAEVLDFSTRIGKDNQVRALRAADTFRREPTLMNATEIVSECDRGGPASAALVPLNAREHVRRVMENSRQGILATFADEKRLAEERIKNLGHGSQTEEEQQFLKELGELSQKNGVALINDAERLHHKFFEWTEDLSQMRGRRPFGRDRARDADTRLRAIRADAERPAFATDLFGNLAETLAQRVDAEITPVMIDAIQRGEP